MTDEHLLLSNVMHPPVLLDGAGSELSLSIPLDGTLLFGAAAPMTAALVGSTGSGVGGSLVDEEGRVIPIGRHDWLPLQIDHRGLFMRRGPEIELVGLDGPVRWGVSFADELAASSIDDEVQMATVGDKMVLVGLGPRMPSGRHHLSSRRNHRRLIPHGESGLLDPALADGAIGISLYC